MNIIKHFSIMVMTMTLLACPYARAQQVPVVGSCTASTLGKNWAQCDFINLANPQTKTHGDVQSCALSCYDYAHYESNENCQYPPKIAECTFTHPLFAGQCIEHVEYFGDTLPETACRGIQNFLNNVTSSGQDGCLKTYCSGTFIRKNWKLTSAH